VRAGVLAWVAAFVLAGCAAGPRGPGCIGAVPPVSLAVKNGPGYTQMGLPFNPDGVTALEPGLSTEQDAVAALGQPVGASSVAEGRRQLQWTYVVGRAGGAGEGAQVAISFGADCKMIRVTYFWRQKPGAAVVPIPAH